MKETECFYTQHLLHSVHTAPESFYFYLQEMPTAEEVKNGKCEEVKQDGNTGLKSVEEPQVTMGRLDHEVLFYFSGQLCVADSSVKIVNTVY